MADLEHLGLTGIQCAILDSSEKIKILKKMSDFRVKNSLSKSVKITKEGGGGAQLKDW